jgi:tripartite-type tricarboxylate transporter receptor subunit TctC
MNFFKYFLALFLLTSTTVSFAFDPVGKTVAVVIPFAPGGGVDQSFKHLQKYANDRNINLVPIFKPGAEGVIGIKDVATGSTAGLQFGLSTAGSIAVYEITNPNEQKVSIISGLRTTVQVFVTHPNSGIKNIKELEQQLKTNTSLSVGIGNPGQRMVWEQFFSIAARSTQTVMVPYKGASAVLKDIAGGHIDLTYLPISVVKSNIDSGNLIALAVTSSKVNDWPAVPQINSIYKNWKDLEFGHVVFFPENVDTVAANYWNEFFKEYLNDKQVLEEFKQTYSVMVPFGKLPAEQAIKNIKPRLEKILENNKNSNGK